MGTSNKKGLYDGIEWGTKLEAVSAKYPDGKMGTSENVFFIERDSYENIDGLYAIISFTFDENGLYKVTVLTQTDSDKLEMSDAQIVDYFADNFTQLYGEPIETGITTRWETEKSEVSIMHLMPLLMIEYQDINYQE